MIIEGRNAVEEALKAESTIEKLCVQKNQASAQLSRIVGMARDQKLKLVFCEPNEMDRLSPTGRHQGVIAVATEFVYTDFDELLNGKNDGTQDGRGNGGTQDGRGDASSPAKPPKPRLLVLLDGVEDPHNLGAIIRVCECAGADGVVIPRHRSAGVTDAVMKISAGAAAHVRVAKVTNINDAIRAIKDKGITVLAADMSGASIYKTKLTFDLAIVIGGEGAGVHTLTKKLADGVISLPQCGKINSLNASVATGIILYEALRQRAN